MSESSCTKRLQTKDLTGAALNWAVSVIEGYRPDDLRRSFGDALDLRIRDAEGRYTGAVSTGHTYLSWLNPLGGRIIEREKIELHWDDGTWYAKHPSIRPRSKSWRTGTTPLIAAMRCFVAFRLGDTVDIPEELMR